MSGITSKGMMATLRMSIGKLVACSKRSSASSLVRSDRIAKVGAPFLPEESAESPSGRLARRATGNPATDPTLLNGIDVAHQAGDPI
jgi:hypothetical protein